MTDPAPAVWVWTGVAIAINGAIALVGGVVPERWLARCRVALIGFAAGALLVVALLDIIPEAIEIRGADAMWWCTGGFLAVALAEWSLHSHVHRRGPGVSTSVPPLTLLGSDALHNIADGVAIAAAFLVSTSLGVVTSMAVILHELPEELGDYVLLREAGVSKSRSLIALSSVQATAALGAFGTLAATSYTADLASIALSIAAGTFVFIGATDLLPEVLHRGSTRNERAESLVGFLIGALVVGMQKVYG